jgi:putative permease
MFELARRWYQRYFSDQETVILLLLITGGITLVVTAGGILAPVLTAVVLSYLLHEPLQWMVDKGFPRLVAFYMVYLVFMGLLVGFLLVFIPLAWGQLGHFLSDQLPRLLSESARLLQLLPERYPDLVSQRTVDDITSMITDRLNALVQTVVSFSVTSLSGLMNALVFLVLTPLLVFFFLKDKDVMLSWFASLLPDNRPFINRVLGEMHDQIENYVHGKAAEILIVGGATYVLFLVCGLEYAALLAFLVGISVVIPYVGAVVVTIPVAIVAYLQFGVGTEFWSVVGLHLLIQGIDGNILVPVLFSEAVNMHPVAIMVAVLVFGGVWGVWGIFFAIPLATLIKAVITAWPAQLVSSSDSRRV